MCGLAGAAGSLEKTTNGPDDFNAFRGLLFVSSFRGIDSTGIAGRSHRMDAGEIESFKTTLASPEFLELPKVTRLINASDELIMGHCRSRTVGDINKKNAQPCDFDNVIGTHNGTLSHYTKGKLEGAGKVCATDSEALWYRIDKDGLTEALKLTEDKDAMALVWYDKVRHRLNFYRNAHRPLFYCYSPDRKKIYWASEAGMLYLVLNRTGIKFEKVRMLPENLHWSQPLPDKVGAAFPKPETRFCNQPKAAPVVHHHSAASSAQTFIVRDTRACADMVGTGSSTACGVGSNNQRAAALLSSRPADLGADGKHHAIVIDLSKFRLNRMVVRSATQGGPFYKSEFSGRNYDKEKFDAKMHEGCCVCGNEPAWGEPVKFLRDDNVVCAACVAEATADLKAGNETGGALDIIQQFG